MDEGPEKEASAKLAQHLAVAVQIAEAATRLRQQQTERQAAGTGQAAAAARAETTAQHAAHRVAFSPALTPEWAAEADLSDLGRAWGAAAGWADTDPLAHVVATRVEDRLGEMAPAAMARFTELRDTGTDRAAAMRDVLTRVTAESLHRPRVFIAEPGQSDSADTDSQFRADTAGPQARQPEGAPADPGTTVDGHTEDVSAAVPLRAEHPARAGANTDADPDGLSGRRTTGTGQPHPADVAAESFPHPYTHVTPTTTGTGTGTALVPATTVSVKSKTRTLTR